MYAPALGDLPPPPQGKQGWLWTKSSARVPKTFSTDASLPRISIITPSYNQTQFLEETLRSVLLQNYPNLEYIVIDGGSTDNSVDIIRKYERWLSSWVSERDNGQAHAINKGFRKSTGHIMGWLNSDDCLKPNALWHIASAFQKNPDWQIVCGFRDVIDADSRHLDYVAYLKPDRFSFSRTCYVPQETIFWRRAVWESMGELDEALQFALDYDLWQRCLAARLEFHLIPRFIGMFRLHANSKNSRIDEIRTREVAMLFKRHLHTDKSESELRAEIPPAWWRRMRMMTGFARYRVLHFPRLAQFIVDALSMDENAIVNTANIKKR